MKTKVGVVGASGRTGSRVVELLRNNPRFCLGAAIVSPQSRYIGMSCAGDIDGANDAANRDAANSEVGTSNTGGIRYSADLNALSECVGVIDFSTPLISLQVADICAAHGKPLLLATTGLSSQQLTEIKKYGEKIPLGITSNTSLGAAVLSVLARNAQVLLGESYDIEVLEIHHKMKKDAPSGTAQSIVSGLTDASERVVFGRSGMREKGEIGVVSIRGGDVPGDHTVFFLGSEERIELSHKVNDRGVFARGAVVFLGRLIGKCSGVYAGSDLLG